MITHFTQEDMARFIEIQQGFVEDEPDEFDELIDVEIVEAGTMEDFAGEVVDMRNALAAKAKQVEAVVFELECWLREAERVIGILEQFPEEPPF